jgi:hypothetical protein
MFHLFAIMIADPASDSSRSDKAPGDNHSFSFAGPPVDLTAGPSLLSLRWVLGTFPISKLILRRRSLLNPQDAQKQNGLLSFHHLFKALSMPGFDVIMEIQDSKAGKNS